MAARTADYWLLLYRRTWRGTVVSSFLFPVLYVLAMGVLLGGFIDADPATLEGAATYFAFVAPGLVAAHAMQVAIGECTYPVHAMVKWSKTYLAMQASPLRIGDIVLAHLFFVVVRVGLIATVFLLVLLPFGAVETAAGAVGAVLVQFLVAATFAAPTYAWTAGVRNENSFNVIFRLIMIPMFLFSGAFFPVDNLPGPLALLAKLTPMWHGVDLTRMLTLDTLDPGLALLHVGYLLAFVALGCWLAPRRLGRSLVR